MILKIVQINLLYGRKKVVNNLIYHSFATNLHLKEASIYTRCKQ